MKKIAVIAEKPSVARVIAQVVGATENHSPQGYISGNNYIITWAFGHLVGLAQPREYGFRNYEKASLPMLPEKFKLVPRQMKAEKGYRDDPGALKQLEVIRGVFNQCDEIICATDAGREGELIFRYIYIYLDCKKPFRRLWISSLTDKAIREGMQQLKEGEIYNNLFEAARTRSESDWLVGMNASQALTIAAGQGVYSLGRVQTPVLNMICSRFFENKNFTPLKYLQLKMQSEKYGVKFSATSEQKYTKQEDINRDLQVIRSVRQLKVMQVECKEVSVEPPLLYDLTTLQREVNIKYGFSADMTLSIAQRLYEGRLITYPRTGSRYISCDVLDEVPGLISNLEQYPRFAAYAVKMKGQVLNRRCVNDAKVTDHHALLITNTHQPSFLSEDEARVYEMIAGRMLEAFSVKCVQSATINTLQCNDVSFVVKGIVIKSAGWKGVFNEADKTENDENLVLPVLETNEMLPILQVEAVEKQTKPKIIHTDASLLGLMETAGRELEDEKEREALKNIGIGTPATRAGVIETLLFRQYIRREKKNLIPTEKGVTVYNLIKSMKIADVQMTAEWEVALNKIEAGEMNANTFCKGIEIHTAQITSELLSLKPIQAEGCVCPKCKNGTVVFLKKVAKCNNPDCGLIVFRNKCEKQLTDTQIKQLLENGETELIKGFRKKDGKSFDAFLVFDPQYNVIMEFQKKSDYPPKRKH